MKKRRAIQAEDTGPRTSAIRLRISEVYGGLLGAREREDASLAVLAASIARHGLLQPIVVRRSGSRYALVCGARRLLACRLLGWTYIDAVLIDADAAQAAACMLEEHALRSSPCFLDEVALVERSGVSRVAARCVLSGREIDRMLRLAHLDERTCQEIRQGLLSAAQAEPLLSMTQTEFRQEAASIIAQRQLTAMQARRLVMQAHRLLMPLAEDVPRTQTPQRRRMLGQALSAVEQIAQHLRDRGICAAVSVYARSQGLCIQIQLKMTETSDQGQEKPKM